MPPAPLDKRPLKQSRSTPPRCFALPLASHFSAAAAMASSLAARTALAGAPLQQQARAARGSRAALVSCWI